MSFVRRAVLISAGLAAGVGSAPYLCNTATDGSLPSARASTLFPKLNRDFVAAEQRDRDQSTQSTVRPANEAMGPTHPVTADNAFASVLERLSRLFDVAVSSVADVGAAVIGSAHKTAAAASAESEISLTSPNMNNSSNQNNAVSERAESKAEFSAVHEAKVDTTSFREVPHKLKERFLRYAQRDPESGEFVLTLEGFVRCMLLLPESEREALSEAQLSDTSHDVPASQLQEPSPSSWLQTLPPAVRRRFVHFFHCVDLDGTNAIDYAEFVVLFTFLSTPRQTLERAFHVFDLDDNGRLSEREFCRLLNTIMVDPAVQVTYTPSGSKTAVKGDGGGHHLCGAPTSTTSRAGESRSSERQRQKHKNELSFELSSNLMRPLLFGPLPLHVGAPPGSMHYAEFSNEWTNNGVSALVLDRKKNAFNNNNSSTASRDKSVALSSSSNSWWCRAGHKVQYVWLRLWQHKAPLLMSSVTSSSAFHVAPTSRVTELQKVAEQDTLLETVSYPTFLYRMDYLRWELRAIEFGLCDPDNKGFISVKDCLVLLRRDRRAVAEGTKSAAEKKGVADVACAAATSAATTSYDALRSAPVTWQMYQKLFDIIKESHTILPALQLMLDSLPPVPEEVLSGGAIPDEELRPAMLAVKALVQQTVLSYNRKRNESKAAGRDAQASSSAVDGFEGGEMDNDEASDASSEEATTQERYIDDKFGLLAAPAQSPEETRERARRLQAILVRPTALTWRQFSRALAAVSTVPRLTAREEVLFRALLDKDNSDSLSPHEFAELCTMKETFFAEHLPRFDEAKRNVVQQFFFCMQQLD